MNKPKCRYIYNPVQIAECGGPCEQGPEHCDCGELWVTEPGAPTDEELILTYAFAVAAAVDVMCEPLKPKEYKRAQLAGLRAVLARWGNHPRSPDSSTLQPVPVSERLPEPTDEPMIPDHYRGDDIRVYREGFHAGYKYAFQLIEKHSDV